MSIPYLPLMTLSDIPNFKELIEGIKEVLRLVYGDQSPSWILKLVGYALLLGVILLAVLALLTILGKIKDIWLEKFWPLFYNKERSRGAFRRSKFADHIESEIRRLNSLEEWKDYRFAELEAEVEAEGRHILFSWIPLFRFSRNTLRRERSLTKALRSSRERLILVEGDPGSGKSVALRHTAQLMASHAMRSRNLKTVIPIYLNLKELSRKEGASVDRNLIRDFALRMLNRVNDRDVEAFLDEEFDKGLKEGAWLFLFDSFDEIPEILSSTDADAVIQAYAEAISDFLHGLNSCRGLIASRYFRGPRQFGWPRFRILPLSNSRQKELVRKAALPTAKETELLGRLSSASQDIQVMASNPMFLGLLCAHMRSGFPFPENSHNVFENYISSRLSRDETRIKEYFALDLTELRSSAEMVAFCMAADQQIGLSPTRADIFTAARRLNISLSANIEQILDALEYIKLARGEKENPVMESPSFTFSHRRIQEYFATCVVLREPDRVVPAQLLLDARWRETCVVLCQTQELEIILPILAEAERFIAGCIGAMEETYGDSFVKRHSSWRVQWRRPTDAPEQDEFKWPAKYLHVMGLLQDGFGRKLDLIPDTLRTHASTIHSVGSQNGTLLDQKWAVEVSGVLPQPQLIVLLRKGFDGPSKWLRETAFRQLARLSRIPQDISHNIRLTLVTIALGGKLREERFALHTLFSNFRNPGSLLSALSLLLWVQYIDLLLHAVLFIAICALIGVPYVPGSIGQGALILVVLIASLIVIKIIYWLDTLLGYKNSAEGVITDVSLLFIFRIICYGMLLITFLSRNILVSTLTYGPRATARYAVFDGRLITYAVASAYAILWAPLAYKLILNGNETQFNKWPILPFYYIYTLLRKLRFTIRFPRIPPLRKWLPSLRGWVVSTSLNLKDEVLNFFLRSFKFRMQLLRLLLPILAMMLFPFFLQRYLGSVLSFFESYRYLVYPVSKLVIFNCLLFVVAPFVADAVMLYRWERTLRKSLPAAAVREMASGYFSGVFCLRFLRSVRTNSAVMNSDHAGRILSEFGSELRMAYDVGYLKSWSLQLKVDSHPDDSEPALSKWSPTRWFILVYIKLWSPRFGHTFDVIDEVYRIREQLKLTQ